MIIDFEGRVPQIAPGAWIAPTATILGSVEIGPDASVWFGAVVRGDIEPIRIGARTNVQDHVTIHVTGGRFATSIGDDVTIGHAAIVHGCTIGDGCLVGMGAIVMDGAMVGARTLIAAGSLVTPGTTLPADTLVLGRPAKAVRALNPDEQAMLVGSASRYVELCGRYRASAVGEAVREHRGGCGAES